MKRKIQHFLSVTKTPNTSKNRIKVFLKRASLQIYLSSHHFPMMLWFRKAKAFEDKRGTFWYRSP